MRDLKTRYWTSTGYKTSGTRVDLSVDNQTNSTSATSREALMSVSHG